jgi:hypothetical protein
MTNRLREVTARRPPRGTICARRLIYSRRWGIERRVAPYRDELGAAQARILELEQELEAAREEAASARARADEPAEVRWSREMAAERQHALDEVDAAPARYRRGLRIAAVGAVVAGAARALSPWWPLTLAATVVLIACATVAAISAIGLFVARRLRPAYRRTIEDRFRRRMLASGALETKAAEPRARVAAPMPEGAAGAALAPETAAEEAAVAEALAQETADDVETSRKRASRDR